MKIISDWFVTSKTLEKLDTLHGNDDTSLHNEGFDKVTFISNQRHVLPVDLDKINLDSGNNFYEDDPDIIIHVRLLPWRSKIKKYKSIKKR